MSETVILSTVLTKGIFNCWHEDMQVDWNYIAIDDEDFPVPEQDNNCVKVVNK